MTAATTGAASWGRLTRADLEATPDDGRRYELLDGSIVVTPTPGTAHQRAVVQILLSLHSAAPAGYVVLVAPYDVALPTGDVVQPDVVVARAEVVTDRDISGVPALVVEVLSPSTRRRDVGDKLTAYRDAGVPAYWVVDPVTPRLRVWHLVEGDYVPVADVAAEETWTATTPYAVTLRPADLLT